MFTLTPRLAFLCLPLLVGPALAQSTFELTLSGDQQVPPIVSPGTGTATLVFDPVTQLLTVNGTYSNLTSPAYASHVHEGLADENGPLLLELTVSGGTDGTISGSGVITIQQASKLLSENAYVNVHTDGFVTGEVRAQVVAVPTATSYGNTLNPPGSLVVLAGAPEVGTSFTVGIHNPVGSQAPGGPTLLFVSDSAGSLPLPGFGMSGAFGEAVIGIAPPNPFTSFVGPAWTGTPAPIPIAIPSTPTLVAQTIYMQGIVIDGATLGIALTEGLEVYFGT